MTILLRCLVLLIPLQWAATAAWPQELFLKHFTVDQGLPSNEVYRIEEDTAGYLWITTDRGIVRYDGYAFEEMAVEGAPPVYPWFGIYPDPSGKIYFFGLKGHIAIYEHGRLYAHPFNKKISALHGNRPITAFISRNDSLWISYTDLGNYLVVPDGRIIPQPVAQGIHFDLTRKYFFHVFGKNNTGGIQRVYIRRGPDVTEDSVSLPVKRPLKLFQWLPMGGCDLFFAGGQVLVYRGGKRLRQLVLPRNAFCVAKVDARRLLIGFENGGASLYELEDATLHGPKQTWLQGLSVTNILQDFQGGLWFATIENGMFYAYPTRASCWNGKGKIIFMDKKKGNVFVGYQSGLVRVFHEDGILQELQVPLSPDEYPNSYTFTGRDAITAVTNKGLHAYAGGWTFSGFGAMASLPPLDEQTEHYVALHRGRMFPHMLGKENVLTMKITCMQADGHGSCWLGTFDGLYVYRDDSLSAYSGPRGMFLDRIVGIRQLPNGGLAIATLGNGLAVLREGQSYVLDKGSGLITPIINDMEVDGDTIWLGTNRGISKVLFTGSGFRVRHYGAAFGLPTLAVHELSVTDGWLYFKWVDRLVAMETSRLQQPVPSGLPFITYVAVNGSSADIRDKGSFRYNQNEVRIGYNSINFANGPQQMYRYRLQGSENKWHLSTERYAVFASLPPGAYSFNVQVADAQGVFLPSVARYDFIIHPAFWQQWWFPVVAGLLLLLAAFSVFRMRLRAVKHKNRLMLDLAENQQKALVQLINPHFIFNVLNSFSSAVATEDKMNALTIIGRFTKLIRLSIELNRKKRILLREEILLLERYIELEMMRFPGKFSYEMEVEPGISDGRIEIPGMLVQPFVENAIKHGVMHLFKRKGRIRISFSVSDGLIYCTVDDNGIGRTKAAQINGNKRRDHQPAGIDITIHRLRLLHEEQRRKPHYEVRDKQDEAGYPAGTTVIFSIPFTIKNEGT